MNRISRMVLWLSLASALLGCVSTAEPRQPKRSAEPVTDWTRRPDFAALRSEWALRDDFAARCEVARPIRAAFERMEANTWRAALELATSWVERCPVDMDAHIVRAMALEHLGRAEEADHHRTWMRGLFEAVLATGDGKTAETAYRVIAVYEEYSMLRFFRYEPRQQALTENGIDALSVVAEGEERTIYFDPGASFVRMERMLRGESRGAD